MSVPISFALEDKNHLSLQRLIEKRAIYKLSFSYLPKKKNTHNESINNPEQ